MQEASTLERTAGLTRAAETEEPDELALKVAVVYQDPITRHWANELWDRVGQLMGSVDAHRKSWEISGLTESRTFARAVEAAARADVVVISVRGAGELPLILRGWIDFWVAKRAGRTGALVALIGLPSQTDAQSHHTLQYFEAVARQAGMDFLPHERKLPEKSCTPGLSMQGVSPGAGQRAGGPVHWALNE